MVSNVITAANPVQNCRVNEKSVSPVQFIKEKDPNIHAVQRIARNSALPNNRFTSPLQATLVGKLPHSFKVRNWGRFANFRFR